MQVSPVRLRDFSAYNKNSNVKKLDNYSFNFKSNRVFLSDISFKGEPWRLNNSYSSYNPYTAKNADEAWFYFSKLKLGNFIDINGDANSEKEKNIREENLLFLQGVLSPVEKRKFIDKYKELTQFPDLKAVAGLITNTFVNSVNESSERLKEQFPEYANSYNIVCAGFDGISSVGKQMAFPGSDMDKAYIILQGGNSEREDKITVEKFKAQLWENTDQRILSYNHDPASFPQVYTLRQVNALMEAMEQGAKNLNLHEDIKLPTSFLETVFSGEKVTTKAEQYKKINKKFNEDYVACNPFFISLCKQFPVANNWDLKLSSISRENIYSFGFIAEAMSKGKNLINEVPLKFRNSEVGSLINLSQIEAISKMSQLKPKYRLRKNLETDFPSWSVSKQYSFIVSMIKASCSDNYNFSPYYSSEEDSRFKKLMDVIGVKG